MGKLSMNDISNRKLDHIKIVLSADIDYNISTLFEDVILIHNSLPEISLEEINTKTTLFGKVFDMPLLIDSMTGGIKIAEKINKNLAEAALEANIPLSCGSQRAAIENPKLIKTYRVIREVSKDIFLIGNIGVQQLVKNPKEIADKVISMIDADALAIHLNPLQEATQFKGDLNFKNCYQAISEVVNSVDVPVIVKETGAGISKEVAMRLEKVGISAINISGAGGTSWSAVEIERLKSLSENYQLEVAKVFRDWGIPTAASLLEVVSTVKIPVIASGGIRSGLDIAKSIVLGAQFTGIAKPFLLKALMNRDEVIKYINILRDQLKITMLLTGAKSIDQLRNVNYVIVGRLREWVLERGIKVRRK